MSVKNTVFNIKRNIALAKNKIKVRKKKNNNVDNLTSASNIFITSLFIEFPIRNPFTDYTWINLILRYFKNS